MAKTGQGGPPTRHTKSRIPTFSTIQEEAEFWDNHEITEFEEELELVTDVKFVKASPRNREASSSVGEITGQVPLRGARAGDMPSITGEERKPRVSSRARPTPSRPAIGRGTAPLLTGPKLAEKIAYWFFRLNGCATIENFVVHPETSDPQLTDVDVIAVRFPYRTELGMTDHPKLSAKKKIQIILAEVKTGRIQLNGPWLRPDGRCMERVLEAIGAFPSPQVNEVADSLYEKGGFENVRFDVRLFAIGAQADENMSFPPLAVQIT
jgi:hypothetical protein